jgi:hypothetical protein
MECNTSKATANIRGHPKRGSAEARDTTSDQCTHNAGRGVFGHNVHPQAMMNEHAQVLPTMFEHFASPMVHPITGKTISSYKKLMNNPATAEIWQTAFGKDFGGMAQGNNKTGQKGTNAIFVMTHNKIKQAVAAGKSGS